MDLEGIRKRICKMLANWVRGHVTWWGVVFGIREVEGDRNERQSREATEQLVQYNILWLDPLNIQSEYTAWKDCRWQYSQVMKANTDNPCHRTPGTQYQANEPTIT